MNPIHLDPGIYLNVFPVTLPDDPIPMVQANRASWTDLRPLRERINNHKVWVYPDGKIVYGYGPDKAILKDQGFQETEVRLRETPRLAAWLIVEGIVNLLRQEGYETLFPKERSESIKGRWQLYHPNQFKKVAGSGIRVHQGYDLRAFFWKDIVSEQLAFGLIVDIIWALRDDENQSLNMRQIRQRYGYNAIIEVGKVQGEYLPGSNRINTEVARQRFRENILPFIQRHSKFELPCGGVARIHAKPIRIILGGEEQ
ncbi:hypothetical protein [Rhodothermus marinus]|jgi:hypothetical protein|uniref:hypothetical protein n=1 Tax=Rhodothermus marinus TaxID=29549 RepID=UPI0012BA4881|nr:hypothetical protein [Rhodothermus marinus]BBM69289.1 hypothetical protein RmaAA213_11350 [Rhodothermus marinus]BBM72281.1 hypothetical protein RmaAA338_11460 [Rhodothermus marinus]